MKTVIITGVSGNLGQAVAKKFLAEGYRVAGTVTHKDPSGFAIQDSNFETFAVDLMQEDEAGEVVAKIIGIHKVVDAAVLTVGGFTMGNIEKTKGKDIDWQIKLNFQTAWNVVKPVFEHMLENGKGRIFLVGSKPGSDMHQSKGMVAYGLSKSLIFRLAELMNDEAKGKNIVTSVIVPSTIDTPQNRKAMPDADFSKWVKPEAIADIIYFHCTPEAEVLREPVIKVYNNA
ncbi:MAG TPA: SDR family NAD(P)-dependent oxidoreductase [Chitinophagaceae bacterium]|nr:SDR family NAD(P)-dependent oxidoreductase [Chitinophagaceae bacterium]